MSASGPEDGAGSRAPRTDDDADQPTLADRVMHPPEHGAQQPPPGGDPGATAPHPTPADPIAPVTDDDEHTAAAEADAAADGPADADRSADADERVDERAPSSVSSGDSTDSTDSSDSSDPSDSSDAGESRTTRPNAPSPVAPAPSTTPAAAGADRSEAAASGSAVDDRPNEPTDHDDHTETQALPTGAAAAAASAGPDPDDERTQAMSTVTDDNDVDRTRPMPTVDDTSRSTDRDAARARAAARTRTPDSAPTVAPVAAPVAAAAAEPQVIVERRKPTTDRLHGAFGLFVLRWVCVAVFGVHAWQHLINLDATRQFFSQTMLPYPYWAALATGIGEALIALALLVGLLVRVAGAGMIIISVGALVFVQWAPFHLFAQNVTGFVGEKELLLAAVGLLFLLVGGGGWGLDRMFRSNKSKGLPDDDDDL